MSFEEHAAIAKGISPFTYFARDELLSATGLGGSITRTYYDALGRRTQLNLPNGAAASTVTTPPVN